MPKYIVTVSDFTYLARARALVEADDADHAAAIAHASPPEGDAWDGDWCEGAPFVSHVDLIKGDIPDDTEDGQDAHAIYCDDSIEKDDDVPFDETKYGYPSTLDVESHRKLTAFDGLRGALQWLLDDMTDAGEDRNPVTGTEYDSVTNARCVLAALDQPPVAHIICNPTRTIQGVVIDDEAPKVEPEGSAQP